MVGSAKASMSTSLQNILSAVITQYYYYFFLIVAAHDMLFSLNLFILF